MASFVNPTLAKKCSGESSEWTVAKGAVNTLMVVVVGLLVTALPSTDGGDFDCATN